MHRDRRNRSSSYLAQATVLLACAATTTYFAFHAVYGRHGLMTNRQLTERAALLQFEIKSLERVRDKLERDVALLSPELPNPDLVEEIARDVLGYVGTGDRVLSDP